MIKPKAFIQSLTRGGAILLGSALTLVMAAMNGQAEESEPVSVFDEPNHRIIFTNDRVSVYRVDIMAKEDTATLFHYHENDQLTVVTRDSSGYDQRQGGEPERFDAPQGTMLFTVYSADQAVPHQITVPAGEQFGVVGVEFLAAPSTDMARLFSPPGEPEFITPRSAVQRLTLKGEAPLPAGALVISLGDYALTVKEQDAPTDWKAARGTVYWVDSGATGATISAAEPAQLIVIPVRQQ
jgi:hypothetical protein